VARPDGLGLGSGRHTTPFQRSSRLCELANPQRQRARINWKANGRLLIVTRSAIKGKPGGVDITALLPGRPDGY
jgi:hypothetical protein